MKECKHRISGEFSPMAESVEFIGWLIDWNFDAKACEKMRDWTTRQES
jgi:hypothetical protein